MAKVTIEVYQILNTKSPAYGKFFGRVRQNSTIESATLCKHAAMDSGIEEGEVAMVSDAVLKQVKELLLNGHPIRIPHLGLLKMSVNSKGTTSVSEYNAGHEITNIHLVFTPDAEIKAELESLKFEKFYYVMKPTDEPEP